MGEVDDRLDTAVHELLEVVVDVDARDELEVVRALDRLAHRAPDLAQRAQHAHLESHPVRLAALQLFLLSQLGGPLRSSSVITAARPARPTAMKLNGTCSLSWIWTSHASSRCSRLRSSTVAPPSGVTTSDRHLG